MLPTYNKPHLTYADQLALLQQRGMAVADPPLAIKHLERIGYYRLKAYWYPLREARAITRPDGTMGTEILETFKPGVTFRLGVDLYVFDKKLRLMFLDAIERIEVALRVDIAYELGKLDPCAHLDPRNLNGARAAQIDKKAKISKYDLWRRKTDEAESRARADCVSDFKKQYSSDLPIWMAVELWDFGCLSHLLELMRAPDQQRIARKYGIPNPSMLVNWVRVLAYVRNVCAHHDRLWNLPLVFQPQVPSALDMPRVYHFGRHDLSKRRIYSAAVIAQHFLDHVNPTSSWKMRLKALWATFPVGPGLNPSQGGFIQDWDRQAIWR